MFATNKKTFKGHGVPTPNLPQIPRGRRKFLRPLGENVCLWLFVAHMAAGATHMDPRQSPSLRVVRGS